MAPWRQRARPRGLSRLILRLALRYWIEASVWAAPAFGFVPPGLSRPGSEGTGSEGTGSEGTVPWPEAASAAGPSVPLSAEEQWQWASLLRQLR